MEASNVAIRHIETNQRSFFVCVADILCPHCGTFSTFEGPVLNQKYTLVGCQRCREAVMIEAEKLQTPGRTGSPRVIADYYPKKSPTVDPFVPKDIGEDYLEAQRCFLVGAWHGCAVMARRCMHSVSEHFEASGKDLYEQIEDLKTRQVITPVLAEQAQEVRVLGKHGAHPYDTKGNELKDLNVDDAQSALEFCEFIFDQVFVQPEKIKASKTRRATEP